MNKKWLILGLSLVTLGGLTGCDKGKKDESKIVFDVNDFVTEKFRQETQVISIGDYEYYDLQTYYSESKGALWFYNSWTGNVGEEDAITDSTKFAFFANKTAFKKGIKKITFTTTEETGGPKVFATFGDSAFNEAQTTGKYLICDANVSKQYTLLGDGTSKYFALSTYGDVGYKAKNLMVSDLTIWFE